MDEYLEDLIARFRRNGVLVDTNLLLLYVVGSHDRRMIESFKRTQGYTAEDFRRLLAFVSRFERIVTTPNILTEASNLSEKIPARGKREFFASFAARISVLEERFVESARVAKTGLFRSLGLSDSVIATLAEEARPLVLTDDFALWGHLVKHGFDAINFNHLRPLRPAN